MEVPNLKEERIRKITQLYYSRADIRKAIFEFSRNREIAPRFFDGFGKRPDSFQYEGDVFNLVKKGATSFHCSEELWEDPLEIETGMSEKKTNDLRIGWDLVIDIDCKYFDFAKMVAESIVETFNQHKLKNIGVKFSGSKGFHIIVPWKSFPKEINKQKTSTLFPDLPRKIAGYIKYYSEKILSEKLPDDFYEQFKSTKIKKGIKCRSCNQLAEIYEEIEFFCKKCRIGQIKKFRLSEEQDKFKCAECNGELFEKRREELFICEKCNLNSKKNPDNFSNSEEMDLYDLMGLDIILVSPRHLFRMPYSLHEKTALASVVIDKEKINSFDLKDAQPMKVSVKKFIPDSKEGEATELVLQALDWAKETGFLEEDEKRAKGKYADFKITQLKGVKDDQFPPCILRILKGLQDGKKRGLFALINFFRSIGLEKEIIEKKLYEWNEKNETPLRKAYIHSQLIWSFRRKPILPPNCKDFYREIGVCYPDSLCSKIKNPVNYTIKKNFAANKISN